MQRHVSLQSVT